MLGKNHYSWVQKINFLSPVFDCQLLLQLIVVDDFLAKKIVILLMSSLTDCLLYQPKKSNYIRLSIETL